MEPERKKKIAMIFPYAPTYRERIYRMIDEAFDVDWYFAGNAERDLRFLDDSILKKVDHSLREVTCAGGVQRYAGFDAIDFAQYDAVITPTIIRNISTWSLFRKVKRAAGTRLIVWTHGWYGHESRLQRMIKRLYYRPVDTFLLYGEYARGLMLKEGFAAGRLEVIYNSLDYDRELPLRRALKSTDIYRARFGNDNPVLLFIGRLTAVKNLDMLLDAAARLSSCNVVLIGTGSEEEPLRQKAATLGIESRVWFYGECFDEAVNAEMIYNADLCVAPGNIGLTAVHSMMFGTPCLTHDDFANQMPEFEAIHPGLTGCFYKRGSVDSLVEAIEGWFAHPGYDREATRRHCFDEIDSRWNPNVQIKLLKRPING